MAGQIVDLIPPHLLYCEPYCGGAAVFFRKQPSKIEVLNDNNSNLVNFFEVIQSDFGMLKLLVDNTSCSRHQHNHAKQVLKYPLHFDKIKRAWAFWMLCNLSFSACLDGGYKYTKSSNKTVVSFHRKKDRLRKNLMERLINVDFECKDAIEVIKTRDGDDSFFYIDPPYISDSPVHQGHYSGFRAENYISLLDTL